MLEKMLAEELMPWQEKLAIAAMGVDILWAGTLGDIWPYVMAAVPIYTDRHTKQLIKGGDAASIRQLAKKFDRRLKLEQAIKTIKSYAKIQEPYRRDYLIHLADALNAWRLFALGSIGAAERKISFEEIVSAVLLIPTNEQPIQPVDIKPYRDNLASLLNCAEANLLDGTDAWRARQGFLNKQMQPAEITDNFRDGFPDLDVQIEKGVMPYLYAHFPGLANVNRLNVIIEGVPEGATISGSWGLTAEHDEKGSPVYRSKIVFNPHLDITMPALKFYRRHEFLHHITNLIREYLYHNKALPFEVTLPMMATPAYVMDEGITSADLKVIYKPEELASPKFLDIRIYDALMALIYAGRYNVSLLFQKGLEAGKTNEEIIKEVRNELMTKYCMTERNAALQAKRSSNIVKRVYDMFYLPSRLLIENLMDNLPREIAIPFIFGVYGLVDIQTAPSKAAELYPKYKLQQPF